MFWINCFPHKDGVHNKISHRTIVTSTNIDHNKKHLTTTKNLGGIRPAPYRQCTGVTLFPKFALRQKDITQQLDIIAHAK